MFNLDNAPLDAGPEYILDPDVCHYLRVACNLASILKYPQEYQYIRSSKGIKATIVFHSLMEVWL